MRGQYDGLLMTESPPWHQVLRMWWVGGAPESAESDQGGSPGEDGMGNACESYIATGWQNTPNSNYLHESKMTTTYMYNAVVGLLNKFLSGSGVKIHPEYSLNITKHKEDRQLLRTWLNTTQVCSAVYMWGKLCFIKTPKYSTYN